MPACKIEGLVPWCNRLHCKMWQYLKWRRRFKLVQVIGTLAGMAAGPAARLRIEPESNFGNSICGNLSAPALRWWNICNWSATSDVIYSSDVIWHQALLRNTCYTAKATFSFFGPDLWRLAHQFWVCREYLRPICQSLTCHVTMQRFCQQLTQPFFVHRAAW